MSQRQKEDIYNTKQKRDYVQINPVSSKATA